MDTSPSHVLGNRVKAIAAGIARFYLGDVSRAKYSTTWVEFRGRHRADSPKRNARRKGERLEIRNSLRDARDGEVAEASPFAQGPEESNARDRRPGAPARNWTTLCAPGERLLN